MSKWTKTETVNYKRLNKSEYDEWSENNSRFCIILLGKYYTKDKRYELRVIFDDDSIYVTEALIAIYDDINENILRYRISDICSPTQKLRKFVTNVISKRSNIPIEQLIEMEWL